MSNHFQTIRDILRHTITQFNSSDLFFGHGCKNAFDEAVYLIFHHLKIPSNNLEYLLDSKLSKIEVDQISKVIKKRIKERIPACYITNEAWLGDYHFYVDNNVVIPRSFLFELIIEKFQPWIKNPQKIDNILELCTGSGCLSILLAENFTNAEIDASDISNKALKIAKKNITYYGYNKRVKIIKSDLFKNLSASKYDLIVTNPPYVATTRLKTLPEEYQHEPEIGLNGGSDGMEIIRKIIVKSKSFLKKNGFLIIEIGNKNPYFEKELIKFDPIWLSTSGGDHSVILINEEKL